MNEFDTVIYQKLQELTQQVKTRLEKKGIAIPFKNSDGSIKLGHCTIVKNQGFYSIFDNLGYVVVEKINLPHTAILLANNYALGKFLDKGLLALDREYGYADFEEKLDLNLARKISKTNPDRADTLLIKSKIKKNKKDEAKRLVLKSFEKLYKSV